MEKKYLVSFLATLKGDKAVVSSLNKIEQTTKKVSTAQKKGSLASADFIKALRRVAIVVPIWMTFRMVMMQVISTIRQGVKYWIELESAIARASAVTSGANMKMANAMQIVRNMAEDFARVHAGTSKEVIEAYYRMGTSGLKFRDAVLATIPAITLAKGTYGEVAVTAKTVSAIYRLLGDNIKGTNTQQEKMVKISDVLARAWSDHEVEMGEMAQGIANVGGQAKAFGLTMTQMIAVLSVSSDALIKGGRGGRLFGRSLDEMAQKLPAVEKELGRTFDPKQALDWFGIFKELIDHFHALGKTTPEIEQSMSKIFNIRSKRILRAMVALGERFNETLIDLTENSEGMADGLLKIRDNTPEIQIENLRDNINMLVRDFIIGVTETDDFVTALQKINLQLEEMGLTATVAGAGISAFLGNVRAQWRVVLDAMKPPESGWEKALEAGIPFLKYQRMGARFTQNVMDVGDFGGKDIEKEMDEAGKKWMERRLARLEKLRGKREEETQELEEQLETEYEIDSAIMMKIKLAKNLVDYKELELQGYNKVQLANQKVIDYVKAVVVSLEDGGLLVNEQSLLTAILAKNWAEVLKITQAHVITEKELVNVSKMVNNIEAERFKHRQTLTETLVKHELDLLKMRGLSQSQLVLAQMAIEDAVLGRQDETSELNRMLALEKAVTAQKKEQQNLSSETLQLYKIAQKYGVGVASNIAKVLGGSMSLEDMSWGMGGKKEAGIFKQYFGGKYEQMQAQKYFFEGAGRKIPIGERPGEFPREDLQRSISQVKERARTFAPTIPIKTDINITVDGKRITDAIMRKILSAIRSKSSAINKAINESIDSF